MNCKRVTCERNEELINTCSVHYESFKNLTAGIQSLALVAGGGWAFFRFVINRESAHKVDLDADLTFVRKQGDNWIVECVALVKNPGNVRLNFKEFTYELHHALSSDDFSRQTTEGGTAEGSDLGVGSLRVLFMGSWLNEGEDGKAEEETQKAISPPAWCALQLVSARKAGEDEYTYLEPGERTRYSFLASLPADTTVVLLKCDFYDKNDHVESVRKGYSVPASEKERSANDRKNLS